MAQQGCVACRVASVVFGLVFVLHAWRLITGTQVVFGTWTVPMAVSWVGVVVSGGLAWWTWQASGS